MKSCGACNRLDALTKLPAHCIFLEPSGVSDAQLTRTEQPAQGLLNRRFGFMVIAGLLAMLTGCATSTTTSQSALRTTPGQTMPDRKPTQTPAASAGQSSGKRLIESSERTAPDFKEAMAPPDKNGAPTSLAGPELMQGKAVRALQRGRASWYGSRFHGRRTANGERYNMHALTAAHKTLPFGTLVRVRSLLTGLEVDVRINDRGPFLPGRVIDVSHAAAQALGMMKLGVKDVLLLVQTSTSPAADLALPKASRVYAKGWPAPPIASLAASDPDDLAKARP